MVEVRVLIDNFYDNETKNYHEVLRDDKKIALNGKLMFTGDIYEVSEERAKVLSNLKYVEIKEKEKKEKKAVVEDIKTEE